MDPVVAVQLLGGAARYTELLAHGVPRRALLAACADGRLVRIATGAVCLPEAEKAPATVAVRLGAVLSCAAAAQHHRLEVFGAHAIHVTRAEPLPVRQKGVIVHRRPVLADARATTLLQTLLDCARCLQVPEAVGILDSALRQGRVEPGELRALIPPSGPHARQVAQVVGLTDPAAHSVLESQIRVLLVLAGLGPVQSQVHFDRVGWVDFLLQGWLVIEVDGFSVHRDRFNEDRRRDAELTRLGLVVLRFTYYDVLNRPEWVLQVVRETLVARAGRAPQKASAMTSPLA